MVTRALLLRVGAKPGKLREYLKKTLGDAVGVG